MSGKVSRSLFFLEKQWKTIHYSWKWRNLFCWLKLICPKKNQKSQHLFQFVLEWKKRFQSRWIFKAENFLIWLFSHTKNITWVFCEICILEEIYNCISGLLSWSASINSCKFESVSCCEKWRYLVPTVRTAVLLVNVKVPPLLKIPFPALLLI